MMICCSRKVVGAAFSISFLWFVLFVHLADCNARSDTITISSLSRSFKPVEVQKRGLPQNFDVNYVSKRRVPNGPDPIHNRGMGTSRLPPT
ncbi:hypothetical protein CDL12_27713 [Handroanthus impetiginosus]|uniref:CLAVATA3/ESR (CLE)-related protein 25 n=1 Tax=Handroanthus impetiginosus TaxID=429701 RepID=A0A2G9G3B9_9LAMI|nr:hypothetical protein CDL12_27713 [Handroanthus impetiginosus]